MMMKASSLSRVMLASLLVFVIIEWHVQNASAFVVATPFIQGQSTAFTILSPQRQQRHRSVYLSSDDNHNDNDPDDPTSSYPRDDESLFTALRERQASLSQRNDEIQDQWRTGTCTQRGVPLPDWVRRVSVQSWPIAACGSARGDVYLMHCETGMLLGRGASTNDQRKYADDDDDDSISPELASATSQLFGDFDGGGTLALALNWNQVVAHAGRTGGVDFWKLDTSTATTTTNDDDDDEQIPALQPLGALLGNVLVTSLQWYEDDLWVGTQDGRVMVYTLEDQDIGLSNLQPERSWDNLGGTVLSLSIHEELDVTVAATSNGAVTLLNVDDDDDDEHQQQSRTSFYPPFDSGRMRANVYPLCATIVEQIPDHKKRTFSLAIGGNDGSIFLQSLQLTNDDPPVLDWKEPFSSGTPQRLSPGHMRPCKCLVSPFPGLVVSGGQDGTIRFWDLETKQGMFLMAGLKVWLGSLWSDGRRMISDGADNAILVSDFGETPPSEE